MGNRQLNLNNPYKATIHLKATRVTVFMRFTSDTVELVGWFGLACFGAYFCCLFVLLVLLNNNDNNNSNNNNGTQRCNSRFLTIFSLCY